MIRLNYLMSAIFVAIMTWIISPVIAFAQEVVDAGDAIPGLVEQLTVVLSTPGPFRVIGSVAIVVSILMAVLKSDQPPWSFIPKPPKAYLPYAAAVLGAVIASIESYVSGTAIVPAIISGLLAGATSVIGYDFVKARRKAREETEEVEG